jgi:hypothetical protein
MDYGRLENGRYKVELSPNVAEQSAKRAALAAKVLNTALVIIFSLGAVLALASGEVLLAAMLTTMAMSLAAHEPVGKIELDRVLEERRYPISCKDWKGNPIDRPYYVFWKMKLDPCSKSGSVFSKQ